MHQLRNFNTYLNIYSHEYIFLLIGKNDPEKFKRLRKNGDFD